MSDNSNADDSGGKGNSSGNDEDGNELDSIVTQFDRLCFSIGDLNAIEIVGGDHNSGNASANDDHQRSYCYFELQEHSKALARQMHFRYRPSCVLVDCQGWPAAEVVATLACMRIQIPFVPASCMEQHSMGRLNPVVDLLRKYGDHASDGNALPCNIIAITVCKDDQDPILSIFQQANVHSILYLDSAGAMREQIAVPQDLPPLSLNNNNNNNNDDSTNDDLYILFTSGTTSTSKAVVGSHRFTIRRLAWFQTTFSQSSRIARRSKLTFVDGITELWNAILQPESLLVASPPSNGGGGGGDIANIIRQTQCTQILMLPSQLSQFMTTGTQHALQRILISGEICARQVWQRFQHYNSDTTVELINLYGQTESTGDCCAAVLTAATAMMRQTISVGKPIAGNRLRIDDATDELVIVSGTLCNGYVGMDGTVQAMSEFRTGDVGFCHNGMYYITGRTDEVIKRNGVWTSPQQVLAAFLEHTTAATVEAAAVLVDEEVYVVCCDRSIVQDFSRQNMQRQHNLPWNWIPRRVVWHSTIPRKVGGAAKIDRDKLRQIVRSELGQELKQMGDAQRDIDEASSFAQIVSIILQIPTDHVAMNQSFVDLGGNSATAIALLYSLRSKSPTTAITVMAILTMDSLSDLRSMWNGTMDSSKPAKRRKREELATIARYTPSPREKVSERHATIEMQACVDATPLVTTGENGSTRDGMVYAVCQGGVIVLIDCTTTKVVSHHCFPEFRLQAGPTHIPNSDSILICGYSITADNGGMIARLSADLKRIEWQRTMSDGIPEIRLAPILWERDQGEEGEEVWVVSGDELRKIDVETGALDTKCCIKLPHPVSCSPLARQRNGAEVLVLGVSDYDGGLMIVKNRDDNSADGCEDNQGQLRISEILQYTVGPIYNDMLGMDNSIMIAADSWGSLHRIDIQTGECIMTTKVSDCALSAPERHADGLAVLVGSYDGTLHCVQPDGSISWAVSCHSTIYTKPLSLRNGKVFVATTGGHLVFVSSVDGTILRSDRAFSAENWSNPVEAEVCHKIVFGARDSKLHLIDTI